jgi:hypothetical protein
VITEGLRLAAKIAVALEYASTEGGRSCVKSVVVMEYAITGKTGDIALSAAGAHCVLTRRASTNVQNAKGSRGDILSSLTPFR